MRGLAGKERKISTLRTLDSAIVKEIVEFRRGAGYVLDFSDREFAQFFAMELDVDIDDPIYSANGGSKGNRLRTFLQRVDNPTAVRALQALWEERVRLIQRHYSADPVANAGPKFLTLITKLQGGPSVGSGAPPAPASNRQLFTTLKEELLRIQALQPHDRGYAFEAFLKQCFEASGLRPREPFRNFGEQIDGSFQLDSDTYLLEAKWIAAPIDNGPLHSFHGKVEQKAHWARGLFVSFSGFTEGGLQSFGRGKRVICMEGRDLYEALDREIPIKVMLEAKVRRAAETGHPFTPLASLFPP